MLIFTGIKKGSPFSPYGQPKRDGKTQAFSLRGRQKIPLLRRCRYESQSYFGLHRVQTAQLQHHEEQEERSWQARNEQVLSFLQETHASQGNQIGEKGGTVEMSSTQTKDTKKGRFNPVNLAKRIGRFFKDMRGETKKIVWPTRKQVINNTIVVLVMMLIVGIFIWGVDAIMSLLVNAFLTNA